MNNDFENDEFEEESYAELEEESNDSIDQSNTDSYMDGLSNEGSYEEMQPDYSQTFSSNNLNYQKEQLQNQIRNSKKNQNTAQRLRQRNSNTLARKVESSHSTSSNNEEQNLENDNQDSNNNASNKLNPTDKLKNFVNNGKDAVKQKAKQVSKEAASGIANGIKTLATSPATAPAFWTTVVIALLIIMVPVFIAILDDDNSGGGSSGGSSNNNRNNQSVTSTISLTSTDLSRTQFIDLCNKRSENDSSHKFFYDKCDKIYDISIENNFNPEMVVIRAISEGFSPGSINNNYWGIRCFNNGGVKACASYATFEEGVKAFINNVSQYQTIEDMAKRYAYIGDNWYNPGSWSNGGCKYYPYIKQYMSSSRASQVEGYCDSSKACRGTSCQPTNDEDQLAYAKYQVQIMVNHGNTVFGKVTSDIGGAFAGDFRIRTKNDKPNWLTAPDSNYYTKDMSSDPFQCVWYAKSRVYEIVSTMPNSDKEKVAEVYNALIGTGGHGSHWYDNAINPESKMSIFESSNDYTKPRPGAMISWKWDDARWAKSIKEGICTDNCGHVGIIESVDEENQTVIISDGWKKCGRWNDSTCLGFGSRSIAIKDIPTFGNSGMIFLGYVYVADYVTGG